MSRGGAPRPGGISLDRFQAPEVSFLAGEIIYEEGQPSHHAYLILEGQVLLTRASGVGESEPAVLEAGEVFGERGLLEDSPRNATAVAKGGVRAQPLHKEDLLRIIAANPDDAQAMLRLFSARLAPSRDVALTEARPKVRRQAPLGGRLAGWFTRQTPSLRERQEIMTEFQPDALEIETRRLPFAAKAIQYTIVATIVTAVVWMSLAFVDRVVVAQGKLVTDAPQISLQPLSTSIIRSLDVRVGEVVQAGATLATLDPTFAESDLEANRRSLLQLEAEEARLEAELTDRPPAAFSPDPAIHQLHADILLRRQAERQARGSAYDAQVRDFEAQQATIEAQLEELDKQVEILATLEDRYRILSEQKVSSESEWLQIKYQLSEAQREHARLSKTLLENLEKIDALRHEKAHYQDKLHADTAARLSEVRQDKDKLQQQTRKSDRLATLVHFVAPVRAIVQDMGRFSVGSVIREGETFMVLVPMDVPLEAEVNVHPRDISYLRKGDEARVKLESLPYQRHGSVHGLVETISPDVFEEKIEGLEMPVYKVRIPMPRNPELREVPEDFQLIPGMTVTAEIKVGTRRLITYILYPVIRTLDTGLRDP